MKSPIQTNLNLLVLEQEGYGLLLNQTGFCTYYMYLIFYRSKSHQTVPGLMLPPSNLSLSLLRVTHWIKIFQLQRRCQKTRNRPLFRYILFCSFETVFVRIMLQYFRNPLNSVRVLVHMITGTYIFYRN